MSAPPPRDAHAPLLPRAELLRGSRDPEALGRVIDRAEQALRSWEPVWTGFVTAAVREEAAARLGELSELELSSAGGVPGAERQRLLLRRAECAAAESELPEPPLMGLVLSGNFLFDPATPADVREGLQAAGAQEEELGDLWIRGDRGAQAVVSPELASRLQGGRGQVRSVEVELEAVPLERLQPPARPLPRQITTVEASRRLDAVASAGFGLSRSRMAELIRSGAVRINWQPTGSASREVAVGDRIQLESRGELAVEAIERTKRERWRVVLHRS